MMRVCLIAIVLVSLAYFVEPDTALADSPVLKVATFDVDATPPLGSPVAYAPATKIVDPLHAKGIVLLPNNQAPIVLCAVDWIGISNGGHDQWRSTIAEAAGTTSDRVAVHVIHQHDGPRYDSDAIALFPSPKQAASYYDTEFVGRVLSDVSTAIKACVLDAKPVTHLGVGRAQVEKVASNRRILGPDGKVVGMRFSSCVDEKLIAEPEGVIDPCLRLISLWDGEQPLVSLSYYATHPQSHYGKGEVTCEFVGLARAELEKVTGVVDVHFTGAGGNVAAGKYNDGSPENRPVLTQRLAMAMKTAWKATEKVPLSADSIEWREELVQLPVAEHLKRESLQATLDNAESSASQLSEAASNLAWLERCLAGRKTVLSCLKIGDVYMVHMPGELFVEFQLGAQAIRPDDTVCMAAYGDYGPGYIGTKVAYGQGGYETSQRASRVSPDVESILTDALDKLLK